MHDFYQVLGVARDASPKLVKLAFEGKLKALADPAYGASPADRREEERLLREAFVTLSMEAKRGPYDAKLAAFEEEGAGNGFSRPGWHVPAAVATCVALAAGAYWVSDSREKERMRLEGQRLAMERQKEDERRKAQAEEARLLELQERREAVVARTRESSEQMRIQRERADYDRLRRTEEAQARYGESARERQERNALHEKQREEERLRREEEGRRRAALSELERQKDYLRRQEFEEERIRVERHERVQREARERDYQLQLEEQRRRQQEGR